MIAYFFILYNLAASQLIYDGNDRLWREELRHNGGLVSSVEYGYDNNGNTKTKTKKDAADNGVETVTYSWNKENRLVGVSALICRLVMSMMRMG
jgi:hypothetical protein